ncbi:CIC11C00000000778 [Sungouiella intermedia]|uniref:CIC11C00000000778 n=1 Tax=Sungouiella intermedia TaxID=45354 RepID=A0A1L0C0D8_9ASCO|nr:CIC11C00000000778 [[Candida] intermedia]
MSLAYLLTLLPLDDSSQFDATKPDSAQSNLEASESLPPLHDLSDQELGVLTARFELFAGAIGPFKARLAPIETFLDNFNKEICDLSDTLYSLQEMSSKLNHGLDLQRELVDQLNPIILDLMIPRQWLSPFSTNRSMRNGLITSVSLWRSSSLSKKYGTTLP